MISIPPRPPSPPVKWTFATQWGETWQSSEQQLESIEAAATAAAEWLEVCAENGIFPAVKLERVAP